MDWLVTILVIAGVLLVVAMVPTHWWPDLRSRPDIKKADIERVQDGALGIIEASLLNQQEKWTPRMTKDRSKVVWLTNEEAGVAVWVSDGPDKVSLLERTNWGKPFNSLMRTPVPVRWQAKLYEAGAPLIQRALLETELEKMQRLVGGFMKDDAND